MTVFQLDSRIVFPHGDLAGKGGLLAVGGDLSARRLLLAYSQGIFPWPHDDMPLMWFCPDPRMVLRPGDVHVGRHLRARLRRGRDEVRFDGDFDGVIAACSAVPRPGQDGTWITDAMIDAYRGLHDLGLAHSVEVRRDGELVGGLYGVSLGGAFFGESMFSVAPDGSKVALVALAQRLAAWGFPFIDCQMETEHLHRMGARPWRRPRFLKALEDALQLPTRQGSWAAECAAESVGGTSNDA